MFTILNRTRGAGESPWWMGSAFNGIVLGLVVFFLFHNPFVSGAMSIGYYVGESMGWGSWVGTLTNHIKVYSDDTPPEGSKEGIRWLASKIINPYENWYRYSQVALFIRGVYWFLPTLLPLYFVGISLFDIILSVVVLGIAFPLACEIGYITSKKWNFKMMNGSWEHQEVWYGMLQDIVLFTLILTKVF